VVEDCGGRRRSAVAVGFQWVSGDGKGQRRCGSARRSSGRCSFILKIDGVSESAWQHRRRRSAMVAVGRDQGGGARVRGERCRACTSAERVRAGLDHGFYRVMEGEGAVTGVVAINGHWGPAAQGIQGGSVMGKE
jgi:hypothetical protein